MAEILLSSEKFVKEVSSISDNIAGKYILPSLREAQEQGLKSILGDALLAKLKDVVASGSAGQDENARYVALIDRCQYYLAYSAIVEVTAKVSYKIGNFGVTKTTDENMQVASQDEIAKMQYYYQSKADACCLDLQNFLLDNRADYPELSEHQCHRIESNLHSAASCGVWLGGARGKGPYQKRRRV